MTDELQIGIKYWMGHNAGQKYPSWTGYCYIGKEGPEGREIHLFARRTSRKGIELVSLEENELDFSVPKPRIEVTKPLSPVKHDSFDRRSRYSELTKKLADIGV